MIGAIKVFLLAWLAVALGNMWTGVARAGHSIAEEWPIALAVFGVPGAVAAFCVVEAVVSALTRPASRSRATVESRNPKGETS